MILSAELWSCWKKQSRNTYGAAFVQPYLDSIAMNSTSFSDADLLASLEQSRSFGFISDQSLEIQIKHSQDFLKALPTEFKNIIDIGSGGGLPSLVFLRQFPTHSITALDSMKKRTDFLYSVISKNPSIKDRLNVVNARAEIACHESQFQHFFDVVTARGFGSPQVTAECATRFLKVGGYLIVSGRPEDEELRWSNDGLAPLGLRFDSLKNFESAHAAVLYKFSLENPKYPRRAAAMKNSPLW